MACYHPIPAYQDTPGGPVKLWPQLGTATTKLPCGNCIGCKTDHAADWARRAVHEASQWDNKCFLTLTYDDDHLPRRGEDASLEGADLQKFLKRLRKVLEGNVRRGTPGPPPTIAHIPDGGLRYLACGEYGDKTKRPHFHALLFNCAFTDHKQVGTDLYESETLAKIWQEGGHKIGTVTGASANYIAQYTLKKMASRRVDNAGRRNKLAQPFLRASTKPPLGQEWLKKYKTDLQHGYLVTDGRKNRIPRATKKQLAKLDPQLAEQATYLAGNHTRTKHDLQAAEIIHHAKATITQRRNL